MMIMLLHVVLLPCFVSCVITTQDSHYNADLRDVFTSLPTDYFREFHLQKRQAQIAPLKSSLSVITPVHSDGLSEVKPPKVDEKKLIQQVSEGNVEEKLMPALPSEPLTPKKSEVAPSISPNIEPAKGNATQNSSSPAPSVSPPTTTTKEPNSTAPKAPSYQPDLTDPGVMKRGLIVFGGFAVMAIAYIIFYRRKSKNKESNNAHGTNENNQFRYGVLQSDDRRDNLELSRIPLTMESDEDEDEDLEIFDLEQKKKSLSYVNLQTSDDYIVHESREDARDRNNLLLDIEDANSDTLINWSGSGNKSIL